MSIAVRELKASLSSVLARAQRNLTDAPLNGAKLCAKLRRRPLMGLDPLHPLTWNRIDVSPNE